MSTENVNAALDLLLQLLTSNGPVSALLRGAHAEGRTITREELQTAFDQDDVTRGALVDAIGRAGG